MNTFTLTTHWHPAPVLDARKVPIYDVFACRDNRYVCVLGPHYADKAMLGGPALRFEETGEETKGSRVQCPQHWTMVWLFPIPEELQSHDTLSVTLRIRRNDRDTLVIPLEHDLPRGTLAAATLCRYDEQNLPEWLDYHKALGIEHFYIYNNSPESPEITAVLDGYRECVTEIPWPYPYGNYPVAEWAPWWPNDSHVYCQPAQQTHACYRYGDQWEWMAHFDADEFFVPHSAATLPELLEKYSTPEMVGWGIPGKWFGNIAGEREVPPGPILETYLRSETGFSSADKCIVRPDRIETFQVHECQPLLETMPPKWLSFNHYRAVSDFRHRRGPRYDDIDNEVLNLEILDIRNGAHHPDSNLSTTLLKDLKKQYHLDYFVETGTAGGDTIKIVAPLFRQLWTIELIHETYIHSKEKLVSCERVACLLGHSPKMLELLVDGLDKPTVFWLDAHWSGGSDKKGETECPVLEELAAIRSLKDAVILIDDAQLFLSPPGPPHNPAEWPTYGEIRTLVESQGRHVQIIGNVIIITPTEYIPKVTQ